MYELAGPLLAALWAAALATSLLHIETLLQAALLRIGWAILSALIVAFTGSIAGVDPEKLLTSDSATAVSWGLLYFAGLVVERFWTGAKTLRQGEAN